MKRYSFWIGLKKAIIQFVVFGLPLGITALESIPQTSAWLDMSVGALLSMLVNYFKMKRAMANDRHSL